MMAPPCSGLTPHTYRRKLHPGHPPLRDEDRSEPSHLCGRRINLSLLAEACHLAPCIPPTKTLLGGLLLNFFGATLKLCQRCPLFLKKTAPAHKRLLVWFLWKSCWP